MNYQEQQDHVERLAYSKGYTIGFTFGAVFGFVGFVLLALLVGRYVPL